VKQEVVLLARQRFKLVQQPLEQVDLFQSLLEQVTWGTEAVSQSQQENQQQTVPREVISLSLPERVAALLQDTAVTLHCKPGSAIKQQEVQSPSDQEKEQRRQAERLTSLHEMLERMVSAVPSYLGPVQQQ
jgi:hypothetical protein